MGGYSQLTGLFLLCLVCTGSADGGASKNKNGVELEQPKKGEGEGEEGGGGPDPEGLRRKLADCSGWCLH